MSCQGERIQFLLIGLQRRPGEQLNELILLLHLDADISEDLATFPRYSKGLVKIYLQHWVVLTVNVGEHTSPIEHLGLENLSYRIAAAALLFIHICWRAHRAQHSKLCLLVGGFNPSEKYKSNWKSSPNRIENKKYLKPPPSLEVSQKVKHSKNGTSKNITHLRLLASWHSISIPLYVLKDSRILEQKVENEQRSKNP